jgi:hypothetical protein
MRFEGMAESIDPRWLGPNQTWDGTNRLPLVGPVIQAKRTRREDHALLIVLDEFRPAIP